MWRSPNAHLCREATVNFSMQTITDDEDDTNDNMVKIQMLQLLRSFLPVAGCYPQHKRGMFQLRPLLPLMSSEAPTPTLHPPNPPDTSPLAPRYMHTCTRLARAGDQRMRVADVFSLAPPSPLSPPPHTVASRHHVTPSATRPRQLSSSATHGVSEVRVSPGFCISLHGLWCRDVGRSSPRALYESTPSSAELMTSLSAAFTLQPGGVAGGQVPLQPPRRVAWKCVLLPPTFPSHVTFHTSSEHTVTWVFVVRSRLSMYLYIFSSRCSTCVQRWRSIVFMYVE